MKKIVLVGLFFYLGVVLFMPKVNLYYTLESLAKKEQVEIKEGVLTDRWVDLHIQDARVFYDGVASVVADTLNISPWIFYTKIIATNVRPAKALKRMFDVHATEVILTHSVLDYKSIMIEAQGDFGTLSGSVDIMERKVKLILEPSAKFKNNNMVKRYFKKTEEGLVYESKL